MKIILTENQIKNIIISETIKAVEANNDLKSLETIINGNRGVGTVELSKHGIYTSLYLKMIKDNNLHLISLPENRSGLHVVYVDGYEDRAQELAKLANSYGGYLSSKASEDDTRKIGELLSYDKQDIEDFINRNR